MRVKSSHIATNSGFAIALLILGCLTVSCFFSARAFVGMKAERRMARLRINQLSDLWLAVQSAETAQRGYLLTHQEAYLTPFAGARDQKDAAIAGVYRLYAPDDPAQRDIAALNKILNDKFDELTETVRIAHTGNVSAALAIVESNYGRRLGVAAQATYERLKKGSETTSDALRGASDALLSRGFWTVGCACLLAMLALIAAIAVVSVDGIKARRIDADLRAANLEAQQATVAKSMFLATMSHELRTPLNAICGMSDLLLEGRLEAEQRDFAEVIARSAAALLSLVNDILDFSKIEAGKVELENAIFSTTKLVASQLDIVRNLAAKKALDLRVEIDPKLPTALCGDAGRLGQIILNLLSNALKFTHEGAVTVRLLAMPEADPLWAAIRLEVADTGIGLSEAQMARLFQPFSQVHNAPQTTYGGTGLGLAICSHLVNLMHGSIGVQNNAPQGSVFWVTLRLSVPTAVASQPEALPATSPLAHAADAALGVGTRPPVHILVAEDNAVNQLLITKQLERLGYHSHVVSNGAQALDALALHAYDLVLMDCQMPEMDGYEAARRIREHEMTTGAHLPILALTANAMRGDAERCVAAGMDGHLTKPIQKDILAQTLQTYLKGAP